MSEHKGRLRKAAAWRGEASRFSSVNGAITAFTCKGLVVIHAGVAADAVPAPLGLKVATARFSLHLPGGRVWADCSLSFREMQAGTRIK